MADFRRWITVLAVLALFTGLASAQVGGGSGTSNSVLVCSSQIGAVTPQLRGEGYTELVGDIVITCTGGSAAAPGSAINRTNITVTLPATVTSKIGFNTTTTNASEALLIIDEPGSGLPGVVPGYGPNADQVPCLDPSGSAVCANVVGVETVGSNTYSVARKASDTAAVGYNVFQGLVVNNNQVTFLGVPVLPPVSTGVSRIFRITNIRINANTLMPSTVGGQTPVDATISVNNQAALPLGQSRLTVGYVQRGLEASLRGNSGTSALSSALQFRQCSAAGAPSSSGTFDAATVQAGRLRFAEAFPNAFKTRVAPITNAVYAAQGQNLGTQNIPGAIVPAGAEYSFLNSESGFIASYYTSSVSGVSSYAGLTDYGTRLKAVFTNVPTGVRLFVAKANLSTPSWNVGGWGTTSYVQMVTGESALDITTPPVVAGAVRTYGTLDAVELALDASRSATAVWEVMNANPNGYDTIDIPVYVQYASGAPAEGTALVTLGYAPTPTLAFSEAQGTTARADLPLPRFTTLPNSGGLFRIVICQTAILYPYVVNQSGFDTGIAIANTSKDPFGTTAQNGTCTLYFYGKNEAQEVVETTVPANSGTAIAAGTVWASNLQTLSAGIQGYAIAVCNFQYAHGYAAVTDLGVTRILSSYLALVMNSSTLANRVSEGEALNQ